MILCKLIEILCQYIVQNEAEMLDPIENLAEALIEAEELSTIEWLICQSKCRYLMLVILGLNWVG